MSIEDNVSITISSVIIVKLNLRWIYFLRGRCVCLSELHFVSWIYRPLCLCVCPIVRSSFWLWVYSFLWSCACNVSHCFFLSREVYTNGLMLCVYVSGCVNTYDPRCQYMWMNLWMNEVISCAAEYKLSKKLCHNMEKTTWVDFMFGNNDLLRETSVQLDKATVKDSYKITTLTSWSTSTRSYVCECMAHRDSIRAKIIM